MKLSMSKFYWTVDPRSNKKILGAYESDDVPSTDEEINNLLIEISEHRELFISWQEVWGVIRD